jgi:nitroreductase
MPHNALAPVFDLPDFELGLAQGSATLSRPKLELQPCLMPSPDSSFAVLTRLIRERRSIKPFDMDPERAVDRDLITALLENANWAPTHGLTEPWRFHIFQGDARRILSETMQRIYRETTPPDEFREDKLRKMSQNPLLAPVVIAWCMERHAGKIPEIEEIEATACAAQNFFLSASAAGLAAYWSTPPLIETKEFAGWLGLGAEDRCLGLFYLGWPREGMKIPEGTRHPVAEKIRWA